MLFGGTLAAPSSEADPLGDAAICLGSHGGLGRSPVLLASAADLVRIAATQLAQAPAPSEAEMADNLDLFEKLGLMEGHLLIGKALMDAGRQTDALPHFGHPVEELYDYLKPVFAARKVPEFESDLKDLEARAKAAPKTPATDAAYAAVIGKIQGLRSTIPAGLTGSRPFMIKAVALMMQNAADDLGESIEKGKIANTVEYHDAMGFARYADQVVKGSRAVLGASADKIAAESKQVLAAFPSLKPPAKPVRTVAQVAAAAQRVETLAK